MALCPTTFWRQGMFVKHFVHKLEVKRCLKLRQSGSPGLRCQVTWHAFKRLEGRTHDRQNQHPHQFHVQSIVKPATHDSVQHRIIEIAEKREDLPSDLASRPCPLSLRRPRRIRQLRKRQPLGALERRALECAANGESQENRRKSIKFNLKMLRFMNLPSIGASFV